MIGSSAGHFSLYIDGAYCRACSRCLAQQVCKYKAIFRIDRDDAPYIDTHRCFGCKLCVVECPFGAVITAK